MGIELEAFKAIILYFSTTAGGIAYLILLLSIYLLSRRLNKEILSGQKIRDSYASKMIDVYKQVKEQQDLREELADKREREMSIFIEDRLRRQISLIDEEEINRGKKTK